MACILRVMDLSTAHIPTEYSQRLDSVPGVIAHHLEYGYLLWIPPLTEMDERAHTYDVPPEIERLWRYAALQDCEYILFDGAADVDDALPQWEW